MEEVSPSDIICSFENAKDNIKRNKFESIANAPNIDVQDAMEIYEKLQQQADVTQEEMHSLEKYKLVTTYGLEWLHPIDCEFVKIFINPQIKRKFRNIQQIHDYRSVALALSTIRKHDIQSTTIAMSEKTCEAEYWDLKIVKYDYWVHEAAMGILIACGVSFGCYGYVHAQVIELSLVDNYDTLERRARATSDFCKINRKLISQLVVGSPKYIHTALKIVNAIIGQIYGHSIRHVSNTEYYNYQGNCDIDDLVKSNRDPTNVKTEEILFAEEKHFLMNDGVNAEDFEWGYEPPATSDN